ncbi:hypothetical protein ACL02O_05090 [Micromonospora sp. MS34]|uniref:hypothetical protein n=1 Tax=Micromonospora sp. MS34 TaxID=3385971 RepID=UPI0039A174BB
MQPSYPAPTQRRNVWMWAGAAAGFGLAVTSFLGARHAHPAAAPSRPPAENFVVTGAVVLDGGTSFIPDDHGGCAGTGGHADIKDGTPVLLTTGAAMAGGRLTDGRTLTDGTCRFWFAVRGVPAGQDTYLLMVAGQDPRQFTEQELKSTVVTLRLG